MRNIIMRVISISVVVILASGIGITAFAEAEAFEVKQVSVNKPEVTVYFDIPGAPNAAALETKTTLGGEVLTPVSVESFESSNEGVWYIFAVDCSTSMTSGQMTAIRDAIADVAENMRNQDRISIVTFGLTVDVPLDLSNDKDQIIAAASELRADQNGTLFYDALIKIMELGAQYGDDIPERREAFVISDAEDYNVGGFVKEEVDAALELSPVTIRAFGINNSGRAAVDAFGAMARLSGGSIDVVTQNTLRETVTMRAENMTTGYIAKFTSMTNIVSNGKEEMRFDVSDSSTDYSEALEAVVLRWIPDTEPPQVLSVEQTAASTIRVTFSELMLGCNDITSFRIEDNNGDLLGLSGAVYDETDFSVTLAFMQQPLGVSLPLTISYPGVTDASMEKNAVTESSNLNFKGASPTPSPTPVEPGETIIIEETIDPAVWLFGTLAIVLVILGIAFGIIRSRGGLVRVDGKLRFAGNTKREVIVTEQGDAVQYEFVTGKVPEIKLRVIDAGGRAKEISVPVQGSIFVGRAAGNDITLDDPRMSRQHFVIEAKDGVFIIQNLSDSTGTILNGVPLTAPHVLATGDKIEAGNITFVIL